MSREADGMEFGWCGPIGDAKTLSRIGFDFIELPLAPMKLEDAACLASASAAVRRPALPPLAFNVYLPRDMVVVGPEVDTPRLQALNWSADALTGTGVTLEIEPLNAKESHLANSVDETVRYASTVDRPETRVLADYYHMDEETEPFDTLVRNAAWLTHIHLADTGRLNPGSGTYDHPGFFGALKHAGYSGGSLRSAR